MDRHSLISAVAVTLLAPVAALAQGRTWDWDWSMHPMMFMWGAGGLVMMVMMLVLQGRGDHSPLTSFLTKPQ